MREVSLVVMTLPGFPNVLVVDDDSGHVAIVTSVLRKSGFRVLSASSGLAAIDIAGRSHERIYLLLPRKARVRPSTARGGLLSPPPGLAAFLPRRDNVRDNVS